MSDDRTPARDPDETRAAARPADPEGRGSEARSIEILAGKGATAAPERRVGPYVLQQKLGDGAFGVVYRAVLKAEGFQQTAAIKVARRYAATEHDLWRFRLEQKILSALKHEGIARFLQGGETDDGDLWIAMEFVDGQPIDVYCDRNQLSVSDRLRLFLMACDAVQYAHQNAVIHRDLKPSHIVVITDRVTGRATVKLLDFGIAKVLNKDAWGIADSTVPGGAPQTPHYAAPEQLLHDTEVAVNAATDVYALGVVLCELLAGHRPYVLESPDVQGQVAELIEILKARTDPPPPSATMRPSAGTDAAAGARESAIAAQRGVQPGTLRRQLAGDLDTIVLKALRHEQHQRYASVEQFAEDIRRYLEDEPIAARPATVTYRVSKWARRHKGWVTVTLLIALAIGLAIGLLITSSNRRQLDKKLEEINGRATVLVDELLGDVYAEIRKLDGSLEARGRLIEVARVEIDKLVEEVPDDPGVTLLLARAHNRLGELESDLGQDEAALQSHEQALRQVESALALDPTDLSARRAFVQTRIHLGDRHRRLEQDDQAVAAYTTALDEAERLVRDDATFESRWVHAKALIGRGKAHRLRDEQLKAGDRYRDAREILLALVEEQPADLDVARDLVRVSTFLAGVHRKQIDPSGAEIYQREVVEQWQRIQRSTYQARYDLWSAIYFLLEDLKPNDKDRDGPNDPTRLERQRLYREMIDLAWTNARDNPGDADALTALDLTGYRIREVVKMAPKEERAKAAGQAIEDIKRYRGLLEKRRDRDPSSVTIRQYLARNYWYCALVLIEAARWDAAIEALERALERARGVHNTAGNNLDVGIDLVEFECDLAHAHAGAGRTDDARDALARTRDGLDELEAAGLTGESAENVLDVRIELVTYERDLARAYARADRTDDACDALARARDGLDELEAAGLTGKRAEKVADVREDATDLGKDLACDG